MSPEKTNKLVEDFSDLYRGVNETVQENLMSFGFECGDGWFDIVYNLSKEIDSIAGKYGLENERYPKAFQVKEKFGSLRFYVVYNGADSVVIDEIEGAIDRASELSIKTCCECGGPAESHREGSWIYTLCEGCR